MASLLSFLVFLSVLHLKVNGYTCINQTCVVNCTSHPTKCTNSVINGNNAISLNVICNGDSICNNLQIYCPQNLNASDCKLRCDGNNGCSNMDIYTFNSNSSIHCGNSPNFTDNSNITMSICSNITISSLPSSPSSPSLPLLPSSLPLVHNITNITLSQNITINCISVIQRSPFLSPTCTNITVENIGNDITSNISSKNVQIICDSAEFSSNTKSNNFPCYNFMIKNNIIPLQSDIALNFYINNIFGLKQIHIINTTANILSINNYAEISDLYIPSQSIEYLNIYNDIDSTIHRVSINNSVNLLYNNGIFSDSEINQFVNITVGESGSISWSKISSLNQENTINVDASGVIYHCIFYLNQDINHKNNTLRLYHDGLFRNNTINVHGFVHMNISGVFKYNLINLTKLDSDNDTDYKNTMTLRLNGSSSWINNTIIAYYTELLEIETFSLFSGIIYTNKECKNFSLKCSNLDDIDNSCQNLTLYTSPISKSQNMSIYPTYLHCEGYGCQYLTFYALNGLKDIHFDFTHCPCTVDCIDNCMGEWNVYCSNISHINSTHINYDIHSFFTNNQCKPGYCCGHIINQSEPYFVCQPNIFDNVVCLNNVGLDIALIASLAMGGVILFFFIFLFIRYIYRKFKKDEKKKYLEKVRQRERGKKKRRKHNKLKKLKKDPLLPSVQHTTKDNDDTKIASTPVSIN